MKMKCLIIIKSFIICLSVVFAPYGAYTFFMKPAVNKLFSEKTTNLFFSIGIGLLMILIFIMNWQLTDREKLLVKEKDSRIERIKRLLD